MKAQHIINVLSKFANSFDLKDWDRLAETLAESIECDYDLRGVSECVSKQEFVSSRKIALNHLKTQHLFSNFEILSDNEKASCRLNAIIFRQNDQGIYFNSHVIYQFHLLQINHQWKINKIKQSILWNEGDSSIHQGVSHR